MSDLKPVTPAEVQAAVEALRPLYAKVFPNEPVDQIVLPHAQGVKAMLQNHAAQETVNGVYALGMPGRVPWAPHFSTSNEAYWHGTDEPAYAWIKGVPPTFPDDTKPVVPPIDPTTPPDCSACEGKLADCEAQKSAQNEELKTAKLKYADLRSLCEQTPEGVEILRQFDSTVPADPGMLPGGQKG